MSIDEQFVEHLVNKGYNPRSSKHSDFLSHVLLSDLLEHCPILGERAARGEVVATLKHQQRVGHDDWVIDLAIGSTPGKPVPPSDGKPIRLASPTLIQIAVELKGIFTEHGKAQRNRLRDFAAFCSHAHRYDPRVVAGALLVVNCSQYFYSPLNEGKENREALTTHAKDLKEARQIGGRSIDLFRAINLRSSSSDLEGLEALGVVVVEHDNISSYEKAARYGHLARPTRIAPSPPSPKVGDPLHYGAMIQRLCMHYTERFGRG